MQAKEILPNTSKNMLRYRKRTKNLLVKVAIYFILINLAFVFLYPFLQVFVRSIKSADDLMNVLEHADCRSCGNQEILKIILDEADAFFKGRKTAQEAAQVMDRRAALFIAEAG